MTQAPATAAELAKLVGGQLEGCANACVRGMNTLEDAAHDEATFIVSEKYAAQWKRSNACVAVIEKSVACAVGDPSRRALIRVQHAELALATALQAFSLAPELPALGVHASAVIDSTATLGRDLRIGPLVVIERDARIGDRCVLHAGARIGAQVIMGADCRVHPNAVIRERCKLGARVVLNAGAVIGSDGFGYRPSADARSMIRIPHLGIVVLEDDVEIGANTCVDRAKFGATSIGAHTKIDNLCQVGHNCRIGRMTVIAGLTGISGSVRIGDGVQIGGNSGLAEHCVVGNDVRLAGGSGVTKDVPAGAIWAGYPAHDARSELRILAAIRKLPEWSRMFRRLKADPRNPS